MQTNSPRALILAGGMGTRLQPYTFFMPKPMLPLGDKPLLEHLIIWLRSNGVKEFIISVSYLKKMIEEYFGNGSDWNVKISYARTTSPAGISGQILSATKALTTTFFLLYGDSVFDFDIAEMFRFHKESKASLTLGLMKYSEKLRFGMIERDEKTGKVFSWKEKPAIEGYINVGCYVAEPVLFKYIPKNEMLGFDSVVRGMMQAKEIVNSFVIRGKEFMDIGDEVSYKRVYDLYLKKMGKIL